MFSRFTEKAIQAIMVAQEEAKRFNHSYVGTEHILLGIISDKENIVVKALTGLDIQTDEIRKLVEERLELNSAGKAIQIYRLPNKPSRFYQMLGMKPEN